MKKRYQYLIIFLTITILTFIYSFYIFLPNSDEIWNYGFAHNIYTGLIPYKDFNMIIPPLFAFSVLPFFSILGDSLLTFHIFNSIIVGLTITLMYKKIGNRAFIIFPIIILSYVPNYNLFAVFLFTILILINDSKIKHKDIYLGLTISCIFLTKQTIGGLLLIPYLFYSKNKLKSIISFTLPILILTMYLILNNALYEFIDYCFLGMFNFIEDNNNTSISILVTIVFSIISIYKLITSKFQKQSYFYALMFQIMAIPLADNYHIFMAASVIIFVLLGDIKFTKNQYIYILIFMNVTIISIIIIIALENELKLNIYKDNNYYYGRNIESSVVSMLDNYKTSLEYAENLGYDNIFVMSLHTYFLKLSQNQKLNKFDLINNGNMGYNGSKKYIEEIENICKDKECIFIVEIYKDETGMGQTNTDLLNYPKENATLKYQVGQFQIYKNEKITVK